MAAGRIGLAQMSLRDAVKTEEQVIVVLTSDTADAAAVMARM